jgi:hypothetical protein
MRLGADLLAARAITIAMQANPELLKTASKLASICGAGAWAADAPPAGRGGRPSSVPAPLRGSKERSLSIGFYVNWDDNSYPALKQALPHIDWVIRSWISLEGANLELKAEVDDRVAEARSGDQAERTDPADDPERG